MNKNNLYNNDFDFSKLSNNELVRTYNFISHLYDDLLSEMVKRGTDVYNG